MGERERRLTTALLKDVSAGEDKQQKLKASECRAPLIFTQASGIVTQTGSLQFDNDFSSYFYQTGLVPVGSNGTKVGLRGYALNNERPDARQLRSNIYVLTQKEGQEPEKLIMINKSQSCVNLDRELNKPTEYKKLKALLNLYSRKIGLIQE